MRLWDQLHARVRFWRYRLKSERQEIGWLLHQDLHGATTIDVGAHRGAYTYWMHRVVGPQGKVVAFEPQPELIQYLHELKHCFGLQRLTIVGSALSDACGDRPLVRPRGHWGGGSFHIPEKPDREVFDVPTMTLDDYCEAHSLRDVRFIKCDVQDHEPQVFRGARRLLSTQQPAVLFEQTYDAVDRGAAATMLQELGYTGYFFYRNELVNVAELPALRSQLKAKYFLNFVYRVDRLSHRRARDCSWQLACGSATPVI